MFRNAFTSSSRAFSTSTVRAAPAFAHAQLLGRIGVDLEQKVSSKGAKYVRFPVAVQTKKDTPASWFNVIAFGENQMNYLLDYVEKGALVHIDASLQQDTFQKEDGVKVSAVTFILNRIQLISNPKETLEEEYED